MRSKLPTSGLIRLEPVIEILKASIWTGRLADEKPVSAMLIAEQESAKTECLKYFNGTFTLKYVSDITSKGLSPYKHDIEKGAMRHLVILDLVRIVSHGRSVADRTLQALASLMEEGESETSDPGGQNTWQNFPRIGVLTAITPSYFMSKRGKWRQTGFLTRFIPVSFSYTRETVHRIHDAIANGHKVSPPRAEKLPELGCQVAMPPKFSIPITRRAEELGERMKTYGFRYHRVLRSLAKAQALIDKRGEVSQADIAKVLEWSEFFTEKPIEI